MRDATRDFCQKITEIITFLIKSLNKMIIFFKIEPIENRFLHCLENNQDHLGANVLIYPCELNLRTTKLAAPPYQWILSHRNALLYFCSCYLIDKIEGYPVLDQ